MQAGNPQVRFPRSGWGPAAYQTELASISMCWLYCVSTTGIQQCLSNEQHHMMNQPRTGYRMPYEESAPQTHECYSFLFVTVVNFCIVEISCASAPMSTLSHHSSNGLMHVPNAVKAQHTHHARSHCRVSFYAKLRFVSQT